MRKFEVGPVEYGSVLPLHREHPAAVEAIRQHITALNEQLAAHEAAEGIDPSIPEPAAMRDLEATGPVVYTVNHLTYIGRTIAARDVILAQNPTPELTEHADDARDYYADKLAMGYRLRVGRAATVGPERANTPCLALDLLPHKGDQGDQTDQPPKLSLLLPIEALGELTVGSRLIYQPRHETFDPNEYLTRQRFSPRPLGA